MKTLIDRINTAFKSERVQIGAALAFAAIAIPLGCDKYEDTRTPQQPEAQFETLEN